MVDLATRWARFLRERHPPSHLILILVFAMAQVGVAVGHGSDANFWQLLRLALSCQAFFLLLRLCDEEKDLAEDRRHRPDRPLARGLLSLRELHFGQLVAWIAFPALLATAHPDLLAGIAVTLLWTGFMRREFFVSTWLRPRLTRYALAHTLVLIPFSSTCLAFMGIPPATSWPWSLALWFAFNFFEFSRKTFHPSEEIPGVDSYTARFGASAAIGLSVLQIAAAALCLRIAGFDLARTSLAISVAIVWVAWGVFWALRPSLSGARFLRQTSGLLLLSFLLTGLLQGV